MHLKVWADIIATNTSITHLSVTTVTTNGLGVTTTNMDMSIITVNHILMTT